MSKQSSRGAAWNRLRLAVLERDGWTCTDCGKELVGDDATVDHIVPKAAGGLDEMSNLRASCRLCNARKSDAALVRLNWANPRWL